MPRNPNRKRGKRHCQFAATQRCSHSVDESHGAEQQANKYLFAAMTPWRSLSFDRWPSGEARSVPSGCASANNPPYQRIGCVTPRKPTPGRYPSGTGLKVTVSFARYPVSTAHSRCFWPSRIVFVKCCRSKLKLVDWQWTMTVVLAGVSLHALLAPQPEILRSNFLCSIRIRRLTCDCHIVKF